MANWIINKLLRNENSNTLEARDSEGEKKWASKQMG